MEEGGEDDDKEKRKEKNGYERWTKKEREET